MPNSDKEHERWMRRAITQAKKYVGLTAPNPAVGCIIVKNNKLISTGAHKKAGTPHAEINALHAASKAAKGATAYVTLEPCCHSGQTPPCTSALIRAGIQTVVIGTIDPNQQVSGKGIKALQLAGIEVITGVLQEQCDDLIADFRVWITQKRPYVIYKVASSLNGVTAIKGQGNLHISGNQSQKKVHQLRATCHAVMVGANTWRLDDPDLRPRLVKNPRINPKRVVIGTHLPDAHGKLASNNPEDVIWICQKATKKHKAAWQDIGATIIEIQTKPTTKQILDHLWQLSIYRVLLEGGAGLAAGLFEDAVIDKLVHISAPSLLVSVEQIGLFAARSNQLVQKKYQYVQRRRVGNDLWTTYR